MNWNIFLVIAAVALLAAYVALGLAHSGVPGDAVAAQLATLNGVNEEDLRIALLEKSRRAEASRTVVESFPLALLTVLLVFQAIAAKNEAAWSWALVSIAGFWLFITFCHGLVGYIIDATHLAHELSPRLGIDASILREQLMEILREGNERRAIVTSLPIALLTALLTLRIVIHRRRDLTRSVHGRV